MIFPTVPFEVSAGESPEVDDPLTSAPITDSPTPKLAQIGRAHV